MPRQTVRIHDALQAASRMTAGHPVLQSARAIMPSSMRLRLRAAGAATLAVLLGTAAVGADAIQDFLQRHWRLPLAPQGPPPARFSPLEASLHPEACGTCHPAQLADWRESTHAAAIGPGVEGQLVEMLEGDPRSALACLTCHAPLAEQSPLVAEGNEVRPNPAHDGSLRAKGVPCAGCHVRGHARVGHAFPTYVTPRVVLSAELLNDAGGVVPGSRRQKIIGREVALDLSREAFDTRLSPGRSATLVYRMKIPAAGMRARVAVVVEPDAFYVGFFETLLQQGAGRGEAQIRRALEAAR